MKNYLFLLFLIAVNSLAQETNKDCIDKNANPTLAPKAIKMVQTIQEKILFSDYEKIKYKFSEGKMPDMDDFKPPYQGTFKPVWLGQCYSERGDKEETQIFAYRTKNKDQQYISIRPINDKGLTNKNFEYFLKSSALSDSHEPLKTSSALVIHHAGVPEIFSGKSMTNISSLRKLQVGDRNIIIAELKVPFKNKSLESKTEQDRLIESMPNRDAFAYCEFTKQYTNKVTKQKNTEGCGNYYQSLHQRFSKAKSVKSVLAVAMAPYNFIIAGAMLADSTSKKNRDAVLEYQTMAQLLAEVKAKNNAQATPALDQLYSYIISQKPTWGDKEKLQNLLSTANDSFYFCPPNIEQDYSFDMSDVAQSIISNELSDSTFIE